MTNGATCNATTKRKSTWYNNEMGYTHTLVEHVVKAHNV